MTTHATAEIMAARYSKDAGGSFDRVRYGETRTIGGVAIRFVPAGHILGSAQVVLEYKGHRTIVSGDFKRSFDPTCVPFEVVGCDTFITEATFGLPVFRHPDPMGEVAKLIVSVARFPDRSHLVGVYALGKCQRLIALLRSAGYDRPIYLHGALRALCQVYHGQGVDLGPLEPMLAADRKNMAGEIVLCPPSATADRWARAFPDPVIAMASGWMSVRQRARQRGVELPLIISDHADWDELTATIFDVQASRVLVTHGREDALVHFARSHGLAADALSMAGYEEEGE
jgi:putative mRNA 3-end processing factor